MTAGLVLVRHPPVSVAPGICYGRLDVPLAPGAKAAIAHAVAATPAAVAVLASPSGRCHALAEALAAGSGVGITVDARLRELDFGDWEGRPWRALDREATDAWCADPEHRAPPGGETFAALRARVGAALAGRPAGTVVVTHAGPIRAARMLAEGIGFDAAFAWPVPYAEPVRLPPIPSRAPA